MATRHKFDRYSVRIDPIGRRLGWVRRRSGALDHLSGMDATDTTIARIGSANGTSRPSVHPAIEPVITLAELAEHLGVSIQTLYDLRHKGRGPRGFRVGRELHFRISEVQAWLARLEAAAEGSGRSER